MILVTGATGVAGSEVVRALAARGASVKALVRDPVRARERLGPAVELAVGDLSDGASVRRGFAQVESVVLSCADDPRRVDWETALIDAALDAGVRRFVRLSTIGAAAGAPVAFWDWHGRVDAYLRERGVDHVVLRSNWYMSNLLRDAPTVRDEGRIYAPAAGARIAMIDPADVGAAAASASLARDWTGGRIRTLTGPEAIGYGRVAADLARAIRRDVLFVEVSEPAAREAMGRAGLPAFVAEQVLSVFRQMRGGAAERVTDDFEELTGRAPRSFAEYARAHAGAFGAYAPPVTA